jgi:hypothetical protein
MILGGAGGTACEIPSWSIRALRSVTKGIVLDSAACP